MKIPGFKSGRAFGAGETRARCGMIMGMCPNLRLLGLEVPKAVVVKMFQNDLGAKISRMLSHKIYCGAVTELTVKYTTPSNVIKLIELDQLFL